MPVVKGGVWTNVEDEILKAAVSKYGLNQWQRVSSLLARKSAKQCKARWNEWLDPSIRKVEFSREEDEKLLHMAKLFPTQWRTISRMVGRTATQCLERYQKLLDEAEAKEGAELGLEGPEGGESAAPDASDARKFRPGETDPDPETKPARPDAVDMDEDEKEMLSEARARLANTQGKKAKRKARERLLEDSRRLAVLQKRRELKHAGINIKLDHRKKGEMDYNADIPFERKPALGFYDIAEEEEQNEAERANFDPRKAQSNQKRRKDQEDEDNERKRRKNDKTGQAAQFASAAKAGQLQKIREAEQLSKRRALVLPQPQVGEAELEDIVKMGIAGECANKLVQESQNDSTKGLVGDYTRLGTGMPARTPMAPPSEDRIANEIRNIRALTETQSSLLGGENTPLVTSGSGTTGFDGIAPRKGVIQTPNPLLTPMRHNNVLVGATPRTAGPGATPMRDNLAINHANGQLQSRDVKSKLKSAFAALPKPKTSEEDFEFELADEDEKEEEVAKEEETEEDAAERDARERARREAEERAELARRTQVVQRDLPRPKVVDVDALLAIAEKQKDDIARLISIEAAKLIGNDALRYPLSGTKVKGGAKPLDKLDDELLSKARIEILQELPNDVLAGMQEEFEKAWRKVHGASKLPGLDAYGDDEFDEEQIKVQAFDTAMEKLKLDAQAANTLESKLQLHHTGYRKRSDLLRTKVIESNDAIVRAREELQNFRTLQISEADAIQRRLERLREEVSVVTERERAGQEEFRRRREEWEGIAERARGLGVEVGELQV